MPLVEPVITIVLPLMSIAFVVAIGLDGPGGGIEDRIFCVYECETMLDVKGAGEVLSSDGGLKNGDGGGRSMMGRGKGKSQIGCLSERMREF